MHASDKNSAASQAYSTATCGSRSPRYGPWATLKPSTPKVTDFVSNALGISTVRFARLTTYASRASRAMRTASSPSRSAYDIRLDNKARALTLSARFSDRYSVRPLPVLQLECLACELYS